MLSTTILYAEEANPDLVSAHGVFVFNTLLFLIGGFLVMWMAAGFAMLEAGLVRSKNVTTQLTKNIALFSIAAIAYFLVGFNLMYPGDGWLITGYLGPIFSLTGLEPVGATVEQIDDISYASVGSDFFFQLMFCATTASIVSGTIAERMKLWPFLIFTVLLTAFLYPIEASWQWGEGWLYKLGFKDFAGSTLVHAAGASAALAGAIVLGPRIGKYKDDGSVNPMPGSNMPLATLGTFILWLGWFGFNGGSQLALGSIGNAADVSRIFTNTNTAAAGGALAALILTQLMYKKIDLTMVLNGALAGLVSITAEPLAPSIGGATLIGAVGGAIVVFAVPMLDKLRVDDVVGAISVHGIAGIWGTMAVVFSGGSFGAQIIGTVSICLFIFILSLVIWYILDLIIGIRVSEEDELTGLDTTELGMDAYPDFSKS
tara:strand:- start:647 stop:1933 length:1287 start_codon:yes stop_codon:yes gene_type:complete